MQKPKTVAQYCIQKWLEANFYINSLTVEFTSGHVAKITDLNGDKANVIYADGNVYLEDEGEAVWAKQ